MEYQPLPVDQLTTDQLWSQLEHDLEVCHQYILGQVMLSRLRYSMLEAKDVYRELLRRGEQLKLL